MPDLIITPDVVERGARAMYTASLADAGSHRDTWDEVGARDQASRDRVEVLWINRLPHPTLLESA